MRNLLLVCVGVSFSALCVKWGLIQATVPLTGWIRFFLFYLFYFLHRWTLTLYMITPELLQQAASNHLHISLMIWRKKFYTIQQDTFLHKLSGVVGCESIINNPMHSVTIQYNASVSLNSSLYRYSICRGTCHLHKCIRHCHLNPINLSNLHLEELLWWPNMQYFCNTSANYCAK